MIKTLLKPHVHRNWQKITSSFSLMLRLADFNILQNISLWLCIMYRGQFYEKKNHTIECHYIVEIRKVKWLIIIQMIFITYRYIYWQLEGEIFTNQNLHVFSISQKLNNITSMVYILNSCNRHQYNFNEFPKKPGFSKMHKHIHVLIQNKQTFGVL